MIIIVLTFIILTPIIIRKVHDTWTDLTALLSQYKCFVMRLWRSADTLSWYSRSFLLGVKWHGVYFDNYY